MAELGNYQWLVHATTNSTDYDTQGAKEVKLTLNTVAPQYQEKFARTQIEGLGIRQVLGVLEKERELYPDLKLTSMSGIWNYYDAGAWRELPETLIDIKVYPDGSFKRRKVVRSDSE